MTPLLKRPPFRRMDTKKREREREREILCGDTGGKEIADAVCDGRSANYVVMDVDLEIGIDFFCVLHVKVVVFIDNFGFPLTVHASPGAFHGVTPLELVEALARGKCAGHAQLCLLTTRIERDVRQQTFLLDLVNHGHRLVVR